MWSKRLFSDAKLQTQFVKADKEFLINYKAAFFKDTSDNKRETIKQVTPLLRQKIH